MVKPYRMHSFAELGDKLSFGQELTVSAVQNTNAMLLSIGSNMSEKSIGAIEKILGTSLPDANRMVQGVVEIIWQGPYQFLLVGKQLKLDEISTVLNAELKDETILVTPFSSAVKFMHVIGKNATTLLALLTSIPLDTDKFSTETVAITRLAKVRCTLIRRAGGVDIIADRINANHVWEWITDAANT